MREKIYKFIDKEVKKGYDIMGDRKELIEKICDKFPRSQSTIRAYISSYCANNNFPKKREIMERKNALKGLKKLEIRRQIKLDEEVKVYIKNEQHKGRILQVTNRCMTVSLETGYNISVNVADLIDPGMVKIKVKENKGYKDFNLKGYVIRADFFDLRSLIIDARN